MNFEPSKHTKRKIQYHSTVPITVSYNNNTQATSQQQQQHTASAQHQHSNTEVVNHTAAQRNSEDRKSVAHSGCT